MSPRRCFRAGARSIARRHRGRKRIAGTPIESLHSHEYHENAVPLPECATARARLECSARTPRPPVAGFVKVNRAVVAGLYAQPNILCADKLPNRRIHRPPERMDRTNHQHRRAAVPACLDQCSAARLRTMRLKCPGAVRAKLAGNAKFAEHPLRGLISRQNQRLAAITRA